VKLIGLIYARGLPGCIFISALPLGKKPGGHEEEKKK
jgi:hypothetical protein